MTKHSLLPTPTQMIAHLDRFVRGQVRAKQDIAVAVYNHYMSQAFRDRTGTDLGRHHKEQLSDDEKESLRLTTFLLLNPFYSYFYLIKGG